MVKHPAHPAQPPAHAAPEPQPQAEPPPAKMPWPPTRAQAPTWPVPDDADALMAIVQAQTSVIRTQAALIQHYQDVLNAAQTPPPGSGNGGA